MYAADFKGPRVVIDQLPRLRESISMENPYPLFLFILISDVVLDDLPPSLNINKHSRQNCLQQIPTGEQHHLTLIPPIREDSSKPTKITVSPRWYHAHVKTSLLNHQSISLVSSPVMSWYTLSLSNHPYNQPNNLSNLLTREDPNVLKIRLERKSLR